MTYFCIIFLGLALVYVVFIGSVIRDTVEFPDHRKKLIEFLESSEEYYASRVRAVSFVMHSHTSMHIDKEAVVNRFSNGAIVLMALSIFTCVLMYFNLTTWFVITGIMISAVIVTVVTFFIAGMKSLTCASHRTTVDELSKALIVKAVQVTVNGKWVGNCDCIPYLNKFDRVELKTKTNIFAFTVANEYIANPDMTFIELMKEN